MHELDDMSLLGKYATQASEAAFTELVSRRLGFVYSAALRQVGDPNLAQEVTQAVFIILAQKAARIPAETNLAGWLFKTTRFVSLAQQRAAAARREREQEFHMQTDMLKATPDPLWDLISPRLDEMLMRLGNKDRQTILLHYFDKKSFAEIGAALDMSEVTARKRASRALEKLRQLLARRGVVSTAAVIAVAISANSVQAAPALLAPTVTAVALAKGVSASSSTLTLIKGALKIMTWSKTKAAIVAGVILLLTAGATTVTVERIKDNKIEKLWRLNRNVSAAEVDRLPPLFKVLPTKFLDSPWYNWTSGTKGDKFVCNNVRAGWIAAYAYGLPRRYIRFDSEEPTNRFDFVATLPQGSDEALQQWLKKHLGLAGRREMIETNVLLLRVKNAKSLNPPVLGKDDTYMKNGSFHSSDEVIDTGAPRFEGMAYYLDSFFKLPVINQTGITQHFSVDLRWREDKGQHNPDGLEKSLLEKMGLELVPTNMPVEYLVMDKVR